MNAFGVIHLALVSVWDGVCTCCAPATLTDPFIATWTIARRLFEYADIYERLLTLDEINLIIDTSFY